MPTQIKGLEEVEKTLDKLSRATSPGEMKSTMHTIGNMVRNTIEESFENQTDPWGNKWEKLSPKTIKAKKGKGKILRASGELEDKWNIEASSSHVKVFGQGKSEKGFEYGRVHQWGSSKKKIPSRKFLPFDESGNIEEKLAKEIGGYVENKFKSALE